MYKSLVGVEPGSFSVNLSLFEIVDMLFVIDCAIFRFKRRDDKTSSVANKEPSSPLLSILMDRVDLVSFPGRGLELLAGFGKLPQLSFVIDDSFDDCKSGRSTDECLRYSVNDTKRLFSRTVEVFVDGVPLSFDPSALFFP